jgi:uncharacterized protein
MKNLISYFKTLITAGCIVSATAAVADTTLFEVTNKKGESLYLGGTIHLLRPSDFPLPDEFQHAFDKSQMLVLETDLQKASSPENGQRILQQMSYTDGKNLSTELRPEVWKELQDYSAAHQVPIGQIMQFKPFMVSIVMVMQQSQKLGLTPGVDFYFNQQARTQNKSLGELESFDDSLSFMEDLNQLDPNVTIQSTLRDLQKMEDMMLTATSSWKAGDLKSIEEKIAMPMKKEFPDMYRIIAIERNNKWMKKIDSMLATPETEMILVGSLHLVGEDGLLNQLQQKGYTIKSVKVSK